jgi:hypothetical protein
VEDRPAYYAAQFSLSHCCWLATYLIAGLAGAFLGLAPAALILAGIALTATLAATLLWPHPDPEPLPHVHRGLPPGHPHILDAQPTVTGYLHTHPFVIDRHHPSWPR